MNRRLQKLQAVMGWSYSIVLAVVMSALLLIIGYSSVQPKTYHFHLNRVSELTIRAPKTIEDEEKTAENRQQARERVPDSYVYSADVKESQTHLWDQYIGVLKEMRKATYTVEQLTELAKDQGWNQSQIDGLKTDKRTDTKALYWAELLDKERLLVYQGHLEQQSLQIRDIDGELTEGTRMSWLRLDEPTFVEAYTFMNTLIQETLSAEIAVNATDQVKNEVRNRIKNEVKYRHIQTALIELLGSLIVPTVVYSEEETTRLRDEAAQAVAPSYILQGQIIVQEGHIVDSNAMRQLDLFGYVDQRAQLLNANAFYALVGLHGFLLLGLHTEGFRFKKTNQGHLKMAFTVYAVAFVSCFVGLKLLELVQRSGLTYGTVLFPVSILPLLVVPRSNWRNGILAIIFFNLMALFVLSDLFNLLEATLPIMYYTFMGLVTLAVIATVHDQKSLKRLYIGMVALFAQTLIPLLIGLNIDLLSVSGLRIMSYTVISLFSSFVLYALLRPHWDRLFTDRADLTLKELANLNHPLLKMLIEQAPGTYHHSMMVANLSANAVEMIGGDSLLTRVASYYHDVGKVTHPLFFVENIPNGVENPHTVMSPTESAAIIIGHVREGVTLLDKHYMPQSVVDICFQHHGKTLVKYFYHQAQKLGAVDEADFRYPGPYPQTKEAAVIMIADSVEAASRTLKDYNQETIEKLVNSIIEAKIADNQFSECDLTVHDLKLVKRSLIQGVASMYHTRIEYPK